MLISRSTAYSADRVFTHQLSSETWMWADCFHLIAYRASNLQLLVSRRSTVSRCFRRLPAFNDTPGDLLTRSICTSDRAETVEWRSVLPGEIDVLLRHPVTDRSHVVRGLCNTDLEVAVAAIASELVVAPLGG